MGRVLDGYPWWSQRLDTDPSTHVLDPYWAQDCGEECVAIVVMAKTRRYLTEQQVRNAIPGHQTTGLTTPSDLQLALQYYGVVSKHYLDAVESVKSAVVEQVDIGRPTLLLGHWIDPAVLHWVVAIGYGNGALFVLEPWAGRVAAYSWGEVHSRATGDELRVAG